MTNVTKYDQEIINSTVNMLSKNNCAPKLIDEFKFVVYAGDVGDVINTLNYAWESMIANSHITK